MSCIYSRPQVLHDEKKETGLDKFLKVTQWHKCTEYNVTYLYSDVCPDNTL